MACHPSGVVVDVVGIHASDHGRSCEEHTCCGSAIADVDIVVRFRTIQIKREGSDDDEPAIGVFHVTDGVNGCMIGFLRRHLLKYRDEYDGRIAQITEVFNDNSESPRDKASLESWLLQRCPH